MCSHFSTIFNYMKITSIVYISSCNLCLYWKQKGYERVALKVLSIWEMNYKKGRKWIVQSWVLMGNRELLTNNQEEFNVGKRCSEN